MSPQPGGTDIKCNSPIETFRFKDEDDYEYEI